MNGTQQKAHTTRMDEVEAVVARFGEAAVTHVAALEAAIVAARREIAQLRVAVDTERTHRLQLAHEQRAYVDNEDRLTRLRVDAFRAMGWRVRWAWLLGWR